MAILLFQDMAVYKGVECETLASEQASKPLGPPMDMINGFKSANPFRRVTALKDNRYGIFLILDAN